MAHFRHSSGTTFSMFATFSAIKCNSVVSRPLNLFLYPSSTPKFAAPWESGSIWQHLRNSIDFPFFDYGRNYCSYLEQKLLSGLRPESLKTLLGGHSDVQKVVGEGGFAEGCQISNGVQNCKVDHELVQEKAQGKIDLEVTMSLDGESKLEKDVKPQLEDQEIKGLIKKRHSEPMQFVYEIIWEDYQKFKERRGLVNREIRLNREDKRRLAQAEAQETPMEEKVHLIPKKVWSEMAKDDRRKRRRQKTQSRGNCSGG